MKNTSFLMTNSNFEKKKTIAVKRILLDNNSIDKIMRKKTGYMKGTTIY